MRFTAEWFKQLFSFAGKREKTSLTDEAGASLEGIVAGAEEAVEKPSLRKRLMGLFRRGKTSQPEEGETIGQDEPQAEPETKAESAVDEAGNNGEDEDVLPRPGVFARLMGVFRRREKTVEIEEDEEVAGRVAEKKGGEQPGLEEAPKKGLWARLRAILSRKSSKQSAADLADAGELFSWGEGQEAVPVAEKDKKDEKGDSKSTDKKGEGEEEEPPATGFGARIAVLARNKKVWVLLLLVTIVIAVLAVSLTLYQMRTREHARMLELEKKNKQLQEENKKLQAPKKQAITQPSKGPEVPAKINRAGNQGGEKGNDSTGDCTVSNKENAAEVLKRCIDGFNAMDRR